jgi:hypothetical protein
MFVGLQEAIFRTSRNFDTEIGHAPRRLGNRSHLAPIQPYRILCHQLIVYTKDSESPRLSSPGNKAW